MNILITGASGFIGRALIQKLREGNHLIICQSRSDQVKDPGVNWIKHDLIYDTWDCISSIKIDVVYYLAGQTSSYQAKEDPISDLSANVLGLLNLLEHFKNKQSLPFVVLAGTVTQVGLNDQLIINERLPDQPITFYDISKLTAEKYLKQYIRDGGAKGCCLRLANVFGRNNPGQKRDRGILDKIFSKAISGENITVYGDGNYLRDYIFIDDVISALTLAPSCIDKTNGRTFCIGSGQGIALREAFQMVTSLAERISGVRVRHEFVPPPAELSDIEFRSVVVDSMAYRQATGWVPKYDFAEGLEVAYRQFF